MNLTMSEDDLFWSLLSDEGEECECAKRDCDERMNPNVYVYRFQKGGYY